MVDMIHGVDREGEFLQPDSIKRGNEANEENDIPLNPGPADMPYSVPQ